MKFFNRRLVCLLLVMLLAAAALTGCGQNSTNTTAAPATTQAPVTTQAPATEAPESSQAPAESSQAATEAPVETQSDPVMEATEAGQGEKFFYFQISHSDGTSNTYGIHTDAGTVGEALVDLELVAGDDSEFGLYVKTVGGETLDWDTDHMYWAFYENGEYANAGVDSTNITEGSVYAFVATAG